jgi:hypothetical protein
MKRLIAAVVLAVGLGVAGMAGVNADACPPVVGCTTVGPGPDIGVCVHASDPTNTSCPELEEEENEPRHSILCVGGKNQRKPGYYQGVCIGN